MFKYTVYLKILSKQDTDQHALINPPLALNLIFSIPSFNIGPIPIILHLIFNSPFYMQQSGLFFSVKTFNNAKEKASLIPMALLEIWKSQFSMP